MDEERRKNQADKKLTQSLLVIDRNEWVKEKSDGGIKVLSSRRANDFGEKNALNPSIATKTRNLQKILICISTRIVSNNNDSKLTDYSWQLS